jgi:hypothetical protein
LEENKDENKHGNWWIWLLFPLVIVLWLSARALVPQMVGAPPSTGEFSDVFGSLNALFSGLAFAGVIVTVYLQKKELELQREELRQTRAEIHGQKEQMELQNETLRKQQFEATFFQMLKMFDEHRRGIRYGGADGLAALRILSTNAQQRLEKPLCNDLHSLMRTHEYEESLGPYFRIYVNTAILVEAAEIRDKRLYWSLLRDCLTAYEATLVFFLCNSQDQFASLLKAIAERHGLLHSIKQSETWPIHNQNWNPSAFEVFSVN